MEAKTRHELPLLEGPRLVEAAAIDCIQPGGGFCFDLGRRWARMRRAWLRLARPGYVQRMREARRGECPGCPHDIIDGRDLKHYRSVCGFRFDDDGELRRRGPLGLARTGLAEVNFATLLLLLVGGGLGAAWVRTEHWVFAIPIAVALLVWYQAIRFFRDPERVIPGDAAALLSPSDGVVTDIHHVDDPDFPGRSALRISIYLSPWDVHLNRVPRNGEVVALRYFPGRFLNARHPECAKRNEQLWLDIKEPSGRIIRIKQISGAMARRLVCWLRPGEALRAGERFGMIKYGSRADVLLPADSKVRMAVEVGDRVYAGSTALLFFEDQGS